MSYFPVAEKEQLYQVLEETWEFLQPVHMCIVDMEKAFDRVSHGVL